MTTTVTYPDAGGDPSMTRTRRPAAPNRVKFSPPRDVPSDPTTSLRVVLLDGKRVGVLMAWKRSSNGLPRASSYTYLPDDLTIKPVSNGVYDRLETAREGIDRTHLGDPS